MNTEDIHKIVRNTLQLQHTITNQTNSAMKNNLELSEIIEEIPSQINLLANQALTQMAKEHKLHLQDNLSQSLNQLNSQINELKNSSKIIYYKPFIIHTLFFACMTFIMCFILNLYLKDIKEQRALNQQEIAWIEQSKKQTKFSTCGKDNQLCVKIIPNQPYGKNGEYALLGS